MSQQWDASVDQLEADRLQRERERLLGLNNGTRNLVEIGELQAKLKDFSERGFFPNSMEEKFIKQ